MTIDTDAGTAGDQDTLEFTADNWDTAQTVTVTAAEDDDIDGESADIALSAAGGGYDSAAGSVDVSVTDDDVGLTLSATELEIDEGGSETFTVVLKGQPSAAVTVTLTQPANADVRLDTDPNTAGRQDTLAFTADNWDDAPERQRTRGRRRRCRR